MKMQVSSLILLTLFIGCSNKKIRPITQKDRDLYQEAKEYFSALPKVSTEYNVKVELGRKLYFETKLSKNGKVSCNTCHGLDKFGVDGLKTSVGHSGEAGERNAPTVYNAFLHMAQFWDGRAKDVEEQALGPLLNPIEHGLADKQEAMKKIDTSTYRSLFKKAFPKQKRPFKFKNIGQAIGAFERTLVTPSRFDDYIQGDLQSLTALEQQGMEHFINIGCVGCHTGVAVGGEQYQKLGSLIEYPNHDKGRFNVTKDPDDMQVFKVPGLRNVSKTAPYFHDGSIQTLDEAIKIMARHQLEHEISKSETKAIKAFLGSLTAKKLPEFYELREKI